MTQQTTLDAYESVKPELKNMTDQVYYMIMSQGEEGIIDEIGWEKVGMNPNSYRPCRISLYKKGLVVDSGNLGKTQAGRDAIKWKAVPKDKAKPLQKKEKTKKLPKCDPPILHKSLSEFLLVDAQKKLKARLNQQGQAKCPCCGVSVSK